MQKLLDQLHHIFEVLEKENIAPAIADEEFQRLAAKLPFELPSAVQSLYRWHNGVERLIPAYDLLSLSDAITQYEELIAFGEEFQDEEFFNKNYLPILQFQDSYFLVDCDRNSETSVYYLFFENEDTLKKYDSLEQLFQVIVDAYLSRAYYLEDDLVLENPVLLRKVENKYLSPEQRHQREAEWNRLCRELEELRRSDASHEQSDEDVRLQELSAVLGLAAPEDLKKDSLVHRLFETHDERAISYLVEFLSDNNPKIVAKAAFGLGELRAREKLPELLKLMGHPAEVVRNLATHAIAAIASPEDKLLLRPLLSLLTDEAVLVRIAAARALGQLRNPMAVPPLIDLLRDSNTGVRYQVIQALGKTGDARAIEALQQQKISALPDEIRLIGQAINLIEKANL